MNYLNTIQHTLGIELSEKELKVATLDPRKLRELAYKLKDFYSQFRLPDKDLNIFRPYVPLRFTDGVQASLQYNAKASDGHQQFSNYFETAAKRYLLYAHEICLHDPLSYMLDYFELEPYGKHATNRLPAIKQVLIELARLKPLVDRQIIHIVSDQMFTGISNYNQYAEIRDIQEAVANKIPDVFMPFSYEALIKSIYEQHILNKDIDLYFPHQDYASLYTALMDVCGERFTSAAIKPSFEVGLIGGLNLLASDKLSTNDIIGLREDDNVFTQWRLLVSATLSEMIANKAYYNDNEAEFKKIINEQNQKLQLDLFRNAGKSAFISAIPKFKEKVFCGLGSFITLNSILPDGFVPGVGSLNNTILVAILELLGTLSLEEQSNARIRTAKKNHFLLLK